MKKTTLLLLVLSHFSCLFAQKGVFEMGANVGINISSPVNFKENHYSWHPKPLTLIQFGLTFGYRFSDFYTFRLGMNLEGRGFKCSTWVSTQTRFVPTVYEFASGYLSFPLFNEFHFFNHHLIAIAGFDVAKGLYKGEDGDDFDIIGGIGTRFDLTQKLKWRLDAKFMRGLKDRYYENMDGLKTLNISTSLIYAFEKKKNKD